VSATEDTLFCAVEMDAFAIVIVINGKKSTDHRMEKERERERERERKRI